MIASVNGTLLSKDINCCVVSCGGVGLRCWITSQTLGSLPACGQTVLLHTYMSVKEDSIDLFGFSSPDELEWFKKITAVNGVGPKIGLALLSALTPGELALCIAGNDAKRLTAANGVGLKLAQRIVLELKDKVASLPGGDTGLVQSVGQSSAMPHTKAAVEALVALGYSAGEASMAVGQLDPSAGEETLIKEALKLLMKGM